MLTGERRREIDAVIDRLWANGLPDLKTVIDQICDLLFLRLHDAAAWGRMREMAPEVLFTEMRERVFPGLREGAAMLIGTPALLVQTMDAIDRLDLADRDLMGDVYEHLLSKLDASGRNGQFRTPRHIIRMMTALAAPRPGEHVCDPAMGTGGFLTAAAACASVRLTGLDIDPTMVRLAGMSLRLAGVTDADLRRCDALEADVPAGCDLVLANPPFTGRRDSAAPGLAPVPTKRTELLFLALILRMLREGGRCAVIVPDSLLFGTTRAHRLLRERLVTENTLRAVISMPGGVFRPYAGIATAVLLFTRGGTTDRVWSYEMHADGFSLDDRRVPVPEDDIPDILARFSHLEDETVRPRTAQSFFVPADEIAAAGYDLSYRRYARAEAVPQDVPPPAVILAEIRETERRIAEDLAKLEAMLDD